MSKFLFLTNIPTPYRNYFYNSLYDLNFDFSVFYQRKTEDDRNWDVSIFKSKYKYFIDDSIYYKFKNFHFHLNFRIIKIILFENKNCEIIIGLNWNDLDLLILILLKRFGLIKNKFHFWSEANYETIGARNDNILKKILRKFVFNCADGSHIISGKMTQITLDRWGIKESNYVWLPNIIQEDVFRINNDEILSRKGNEKIKFFMPVRLNENIKGFLNFFKAIGPSNIRKVIFYVAGDGPDRKQLYDYICENNLSDNIKILGHIDSDEVKYYYEISNVFLLPSFSDPSPLSVFEAMSMALPLLISKRCGNHFEAVINSENGYVFDPDDHRDIINCFSAIINDEKRLIEMGLKSKKIFDENLNKDVILKRFLLEITSTGEKT